MKPPISLESFDYDLPEDLIAQVPAEERSASRLLHLLRDSGKVSHLDFHLLPVLLEEGDLLVLNDTKVFPARLRARRESGGVVEILLTALPGDTGEAPCLVKPGRRLRSDEKLYLEGEKTIRVRKRNGMFTVTGDTVTLARAVEDHGMVPLPPYIKRPAGGPDELDQERYQTVYASHAGAVAAPTAGLHFEEETLDRIREKGIEIGRVTLHVGPGTFQPVRARDVSKHRMGTEIFHIPEATAMAVTRQKKYGKRIVAVGTTVVRALESAWDGDKVVPGNGRTDLFIYPGYPFAVTDALLTNFHLPRSTLLMLVCAFAGTDTVLRTYREAVGEGYRFYSYGDAMLIE